MSRNLTSVRQGPGPAGFAMMADNRYACFSFDVPDPASFQVILKPHHGSDGISRNLSRKPERHALLCLVVEDFHGA